MAGIKLSSFRAYRTAAVKLFVRDKQVTPGTLEGMSTGNVDQLTRLLPMTSFYDVLNVRLTPLMFTCGRYDRLMLIRIFQPMYGH